VIEGDQRRSGGVEDIVAGFGVQSTQAGQVRPGRRQPGIPQQTDPGRQTFGRPLGGRTNVAVQDAKDAVGVHLEGFVACGPQCCEQVDARTDPGAGSGCHRGGPRNPDAVDPAQLDLATSGGAELRRKRRVGPVRCRAPPIRRVYGDGLEADRPGDDSGHVSGTEGTGIGHPAPLVEDDTVEAPGADVDAGNIHHHSLPGVVGTCDTSLRPPGQARPDMGDACDQRQFR